MTACAAGLPVLVALALGAIVVGGCSSFAKPGGGADGDPPLDITVTPTGGGGPGQDCAGETFSAERRPLDLLLMLDVSGSMLEATANGPSKWAGITRAIRAFLEAPRSQGLGVGLQYFPLRKSSVPASCAVSEECGPSGGPCTSFSGCWRAWKERALFGTCSADSDCLDGTEDFGPCVPFGACQNDMTALCSSVQERCVVNETDLGTCVAPPSVCRDATDCRPEAYAQAAVEVAELPAATPALLASIENQVPNGNTPTGPALQGILEQARRRALAYPDRSVVVVLATDGLPTECSPLDVDAIAELAAAAALESPAIKTFAIGVFGPTDSMAADAPQDRLDAIARAGGTDHAFEVDPANDVAPQFLTALDAIRKGELGCTLRIPAPSDRAKLDYDEVNVDVTLGSETTSLPFVSTADDCPSEGGWYYEPNDGRANPEWLTLCPQACATLNTEPNAAVRIRLGCKTLVH